MKKLTGFLLILLFAVISVTGQDKEFTIQDAVIGQWTNLYPEYMKRLRWQAGNDNFTYLKGSELYENSPNHKSEKSLISLETINKTLAEAGIEELSYFPDYTWQAENIMSFQNDTFFVLYTVILESII